MIDVLIGGIAKNTEAINKLAKKININFVLVGIGMYAVCRVIQDHNARLDAIEIELSELNTEGE